MAKGTSKQQLTEITELFNIFLLWSNWATEQRIPVRAEECGEPGERGDPLTDCPHFKPVNYINLLCKAWSGPGCLLTVIFQVYEDVKQLNNGETSLFSPETGEGSWWSISEGELWAMWYCDIVIHTMPMPIWYSQMIDDYTILFSELFTVQLHQ